MLQEEAPEEFELTEEERRRLVWLDREWAYGLEVDG